MLTIKFEQTMKLIKTVLGLAILSAFSSCQDDMEYKENTNYGKDYMVLNFANVSGLIADIYELLDYDYGNFDGAMLASASDEAQYVGGIFAYLKTIVDKDPKAGKYIVIGSQQFNLLEKVTESLAGRAAFLTLLPFSIKELANAGRKPQEPLEAMITGLYPPLYDREVAPYDWYTSYIASYIERDVRSIVNVKDLGSVDMKNQKSRHCGLDPQSRFDMWIPAHRPE